LNNQLKELNLHLEGQVYDSTLYKQLYATDASVYRELPLAVCFPKSIKDIQHLIQFATLNKTTLIPRTAGTSLAGQCVGSGIVVDVSKHFTNILNVNVNAKIVKVQPGVIRDDLNKELEVHNLFFGPNTSTSNRCMIGGMVGNNSSGTTSIQYGTTRDKILAMKVILSNGSEAEFKEISINDFKAKLQLDSLEGEIYRTIYESLKSEKHKELISKNFPKPEIHRRNTGYALDAIIDSEVFSESTKKINICKLLAGSEGTLAFTTEITLRLDSIPPKHSAIIAAHFHDISSCLKAVEPCMSHNLFTCEMMDCVILDCTKDSHKYAPLRFFIKDNPEAILLLELRSETEEHLNLQIEELLHTLSITGLSYAQPVLKGEDIDKAMQLRKAGLGLLGNLKGDKKAVACIEDTAVAIKDLSSYITKFTALMKRYNQDAVYYAHAGAGELHLRPILNLKKTKDVNLFKDITTEVAHLVKSYNGSMSGEHGDGRLRADFIEFMVGAECYNLFKTIKNTFDPKNIFNEGKIINAPPMESSLRYTPDRLEPKIDTLLNFEDTNGILRLAEKCNGSGDCRTSANSGGTMCPSYRATKDEKDTTRGRANTLREILTTSSKANKFNHKELKEVFDLCISCKGCKSECPSNVDVATLKAEFEYQYQKANGTSLRSKLFAYNTVLNSYASKFPKLSNHLFESKWSSGLLKSFIGIAEKRSFPKISNLPFRKQITKSTTGVGEKSVYLFVDEFTNYLDVELGLATHQLLTRLGYNVNIVDHKESGRTFISKGFLKQAKVIANKNISIFSDLISEETPLIGIEPSAILSFRDEYLRLADHPQKAKNLSKHCYTIEEFLANEIEQGLLTNSIFTKDSAEIKLHVHCHQKALSNQKHTFDLLNLPINYKVTIIPSGCCGMAGSFGYEKEHYKISMAIGEQTLFPAIRKAPKHIMIVAAGTSCRHQIKDGTSREAFHPIQILLKALN
jgi:FAD/FMN-containing dehydrogenase/Fe-S oxidoreductase